MERRLKAPVPALAVLLSIAVLATAGCGGSSSNAPANPQTSQPAAASPAAPQDSAAANPSATTDEHAAAQPASEPPPASPTHAAPAAHHTQPQPHANGATAHADGSLHADGSGAYAPTEPVAHAAPAPIVKTIPAGTEVALVVEDAVSSQTSQVGQSVRARVTDPILVDGAVAVPAGATLEGTVTEVVPQKKIGGTSKLTIAFDTLRMQSGESVPVSATFAHVGKSQTGKDTGTIAGSAAGGALLGKILGGKSKDAAIGAVVGGAVGTAVAVKNKGDALELPVGSPLTVTLDSAARVTIRD